MTVPTYTGPNTSVANGVTTTFPYGFKILAASDLLVTVNGLPRTLGTHYTVTGVGNPEGGDVMFVAPPAANSVVARLRDMPFTRSTNYQNLGDLLADTLNTDQDAPVMMIQQLAAGSMQQVPDPETGLFVWDALGNRIVRVADALLGTDAANLRTVLRLIEQAETGGVGVSPVVYLFQDDEGNGIADGVTTDFPIPQAAVDDPGMYDVYFERTPSVGDFVGMRPTADYSVLVAADPDDSLMRFVTAPAAGLRGFAVLRGFARPYAGGAPLTTTAMRRVLLEGESLLVDGTYENALIVCLGNTATTLTIRANTGSPDVDWRGGDYAPHFMVQQVGLGKVTIAIEAGGQVEPAQGFFPETRAQRSVVSLVATQNDMWVAAGDLLRISTEPAKQVIRLFDRTVLLGTNLNAGTSKDSFVMPYDFMLDDIAARGLYAALSVGQASGTVLTIDVNVDGVSILATRLTFDNGELTTLTASASGVFSTAFLAASKIIPAGAAVTFDVDQVGTASAQGLSVYLRGTRAA